MPQKELYLFQKKVSLILKIYLSNTQKWSGLKNLDLAEKVSTKKTYLWKDLKTWKKEYGFIKNKKKNFMLLPLIMELKKIS